MNVKGRLLSATHRCLDIPEVLGEVIEYFPARSQSKTLAYLARTCTRFHETAQNALWRDASFTPVFTALLRCFPQTCWEMNETSFRFTRPPSPAEWDRFLIQAARIRTLDINPGVGADNDVFAVLALHRPTHILFPNLRSFRVTEDMCRYLPLFPGPKLTSLKMSLGEILDPLIMPSLQAISHLYPLLQELEVESRGDGEQWKLPLTLGIQSLKDLRSFDVGFEITNDAIIHLSTLPSLLSLTCVVCPDQASGEILHSKANSFPSLRSIVVAQPGPLDEASKLLVTAPGRAQLEELCLCTEDPTRDSLVDYLRGLSKYAESLQDLNFDFPVYLSSLEDEPIPQDSPSYNIDGRVLKHLQFRNLRSLQIVSNRIDIDDEDIWNLTGSVPRLTVLMLSPSSHHRSPLRTTLQSIVHVVTQCPSIVSLGLRVNAATQGWRVPVGTKPNAILEDLSVDDSPITQAIPVALFLSAIISSPISIEASATSSDVEYANEIREYPKLWREVNDLHKAMCIARAQEHTRVDGDLVYPPV